MILKRAFKGILGLFIICISFTFYDVFALKSCPEFLANKGVNYSYYQPVLEENDNGTYNIKIKDDIANKHKNVKLYVFINDKYIDKTISFNSPLTNISIPDTVSETYQVCDNHEGEDYTVDNCPRGLLNVSTNFILVEFRTTLKTDDQINACESNDDCKVENKENSTCPDYCDYKNDPTHLDPMICEGDITSAYTLPTIVGAEDYEAVDIEISDDELRNIDSGLGSEVVAYDKKLDCTGYESKATSDPFIYKFCYAKNHANVSYPNLKKDEDLSNKDPSVFTCSTSPIYKEEQLKGEKYYVNSKYMYAKRTKEVDLGYYTHRYGYAKDGKFTETKGDAIKCSVTCEEAVEVEYGPPVASKAGLCFEYKVRITSRTYCYMTAVTPPPKSYPVCKPKAVCTGIGKTSGKRYYTNKGGPEDDYYECINECDGGKFTKSCSKKCYNSVYGFGSGKLTSNYISYESTKLDSGNTITLNDCGKCYYRGGSVKNPGSIHWHGGGAARYYGYHCPGGYSTKSSGVAGICYHYYGGGRYCNDSCWWSSGNCKATSYLNKYLATADKKYNLEQYEKAVNACKAQVGCSDSYGEFSITVKYKKDGSNKEESLVFPTKIGTDIVVSNGAKGDNRRAVTYGDGKGGSTILYNVNEHDKIMGCYLPGSKDNNLYRVPWSFPGTWINNKTGEITYQEVTGDDYWQKQDKKFCIPFDAKNVNEKWWLTYMTKALEGKESTLFSGKFTDECLKSYSFSDKIDYNIVASARRFGQFLWNVDVKCYYSLFSPPSDYCDTKTVTRVRPVNLEDMFPSVEGDEKPPSNPSWVGRQPGFNWTKYATASSTKKTNLSYVTNPPKYISYIQSRGYSIYNDNYLDYEFDLPPESLSSLRSSFDESKKGNYTNYDSSGTFSSVSALKKNDNNENGIVRYKSSVIRNIKGARITVPKDDATLYCNNMKNHNGGCENHDSMD